MTIKQFASTRNLSQVKVKKLCSELLGTIPVELSDDDVQKLDMALANAAQSLALPQGEEPQEQPQGEVLAVVEEVKNDELVAVNESSQLAEIPQETDNQKVIRVVGSSTLKENLKHYLTTLKKHYLDNQFELDSFQFQLEQQFYNKLANHQQVTQNESSARIQRNAQLWSRRGVEILKSSPDKEPEEDELLADISDLMDFFEVSK
jgi:hypothetical protein